MIELPEALTIARQMSVEFDGKKIKTCNRGNSLHRFAFYSGTQEEYETILNGKLLGKVREHGSFILVPVVPSYMLVLGSGGERILLHESDKTIPKKYHLLLEFEDGRFLTVSVQGWGFASLLHESDPHIPCMREDQINPLSDGFTLDYFLSLFDQLDKDDQSSAKFFCISKPGILGVGNGYLQDILFRSGIHPKRRVLDTDCNERQRLYEAIKETLRLAVEAGGRDTERDLYNHPGGYTRILDSTQVGRPCPECRTAIEKINYLGGSSYFCPKCQM